MAKKIETLDELYITNRDDLSLRLKCMRKYDGVKYTPGCKSYESLEVVFMDIKGNVIQATVNPGQVTRHNAKFAIGDSITLEEFNVLHNDIDFRATSHQYRLEFRCGTVARKCEDLNLPNRFFNFVNFDDLNPARMKYLVDLAKLLEKTKLIIWGEAPMMHRFCYEALDRSLRDIMRFSEHGDSRLPFGGKVIVFGGDFRQILPVTPRGSRQDIVGASINSSPLWKHCKVLRLTKNMRLQANISESTRSKVRQFSDWLLEVGDGRAGPTNDGEADIDIPEDMILRYDSDPIATIVESTYPNLEDNMWDGKYFKERAILAPTHEIVEAVNDYVLSLLPGDVKVYLSSDSILNLYWLKQHKH